MNRQTMMAAAIAAAMTTMTVSLFAAEQPAAPAAKSEPIYGYRMMNDQERNDYRERMRNAASAEDRQKIRDEHHELMQGRAKERGVTLPPREGMGPRGEGRGPGAGMGPGPRGEGKGYGKGGGPQGKGYGPQGKGKGYGPEGKGKGFGPRADCPAGQECPGPGAGKGPGPR